MTGGRLVLDLSSLVRWAGPPVGMVRVQHALAEAARSWRGGPVATVVQHPSIGRLHHLDPAWEQVLAGLHGRLESWSPDASLRLLPSRFGLVMGLERRRLRARSALGRGLADALQRAVLAVRHSDFPVRAPDGVRIANVPLDMALGEPAALTADDVVLCAGSGWSHNDAARLAEEKARHGFRLAVLCYDLIPLTHPACFPPDDVRQFAAYWERMWPIADLVMVTSQAVLRDARRLFGHDPAVAVVPLGYDPPAPGAAAPMPGGLAPGRFALFVSTIEPRKGHAMLLRVWERLLARGIPQCHGFRLVLAGRPGWDVDDVLRLLATPEAFGGSVLHLPAAGDGVLDTLYRGAAFCVYPSLTEGFGLPVIEAFARGKATLASSGGALAEVVGGLSPCLDPHDEAAWEDALAEWIVRPEARAPWEAAIGRGFVHPTWPEAARIILDRAWRMR